MSRLLALASLVLLAFAAPAGAVDCGRLPKGENPSMPELADEIAKLSAEKKVPTEVIKAVAWRESGCQQWRANGTLVYNKTDCGLGMMQLTGATAKQFDVERLKDDWKYNLACGVSVLVQKWKRAERKGQVPTDPAGRRVLENWYYPIAYYWGGKVEDYLRKIFDHMKKRPGKLQQLLTRGVEVTIASEAIPGFAFGDTFTAFDGDRFVDKDGKTHRAPTHLGTIGDAQTLAALDVMLTRGRKAAAKGKAKTALKYLKRVLEADYDTGHKAQAQELLDGLTKAAEQMLSDALTKRGEGDGPGALKLARKVARDYKGFPIAERAKTLVDALKGS